MNKPQNRLGKGLSALVGVRPRATPAVHSPETHQPAAAHAAPESSEPVAAVPIDRITRNPRQPRSQFDQAALDELAASIRVSGVIQPVIVRPVGDGYQLVAGERRWRAAQLAGLTTIPAIVRPLTDSESLEIALVENLQREDLSPLDRAASYEQYLQAFKVPAEQLAARLGESRANVVNYIRLLRLSAEIQRMLRDGELSMGHARALVGVGEPARQLGLAKLAIRRRLSVRQLEALAGESSTTLDTGEAQAAVRGTDKHREDVEKALSKAMGLAVSLVPGRSKNSGRVVLHYKSLEEFDRIAERIGGRASLE